MRQCISAGFAARRGRHIKVPRVERAALATRKHRLSIANATRAPHGRLTPDSLARSDNRTVRFSKRNFQTCAPAPATRALTSSHGAFGGARALRTARWLTRRRSRLGLEVLVCSSCLCGGPYPPGYPPSQGRFALARARARARRARRNC